MSTTPQPFSWRDRPALIERLFPVQKISAESFKEQMAGSGKTLTALGSYWKGRKPLFLNKACILGCLMPTSENPLRDLEIFELLMGMDERSMRVRLEAKLGKNKPEKVDPLLKKPFKDQIDQAKRCEEIGDAPHAHIWAEVNAHLGTKAQSFPELVEQMGIARFGHRPKVADVFCGSGQIPFEAARLGCDVYASDLNPIACLLTWGAFNLIGASENRVKELEKAQEIVTKRITDVIDALGVEADGNGWRGKAYLYCLEVTCPESGWAVPLLPSFIVNKLYGVLVKLTPIHSSKSYEIEIIHTESAEDIDAAKKGTVSKGYVEHSPDGKNRFRFSIKSIRGDHKDGKTNKNKLRRWENTDITPTEDDILRERLFCIQWMRPKKTGKSMDTEFRTVTTLDLDREAKVTSYVSSHFTEWQKKGFIPDMLIERGYNTDQPIRERGWSHWHHMFNPRQLLVNGLIKKELQAIPEFAVMMPGILNLQSKLCAWHNDGRKGGCQNAFSNMALNTLVNYGARGSRDLVHYIFKVSKFFDLKYKAIIHNLPAESVEKKSDIYVTDPPYGDAVKYEEITEFFIAWLRKNPPKEFADWTWDSRRSLAIKGEDDDFRRSMIRAYRRTAELMPDNGMQVIMFTHQSGSVWADMANIIWASGLQVTAAWYVVTETDSALRQGANVTGTILLVLRKRKAALSSYRDDLAWEIEAAVKEQIESLVGLDKTVRQQHSEGLYTDSDLQMAGYAAALKVLTAYSTIDGKDMVVESEAPRVKGRKSFVEDLIEFAVQTAVQFLVPVGFEKSEWQKLQPVERYYLKMLEMEHQGNKTLDNYQNFAKAFKIRHFDQLMSENSKANSARVKTATELRGSYMSGDAELSGTPLRALLYALFELSKDADVEDVLLHLMENCPNYTQHRPILAKMADYIAEKRDGLASTKTFKPEKEATNARVLAEAIRNQRL